MRNTLPLLSLLACLMAAAPAHAEEAKGMPPASESTAEAVKPFDPAPYKKQIADIEHYLSGFQSLKSRFSQTADEDGLVLQGTIAIQRPGNFRLEYVSPDHVLMMVNGKELSYYDYSLDQVSYGTLPETPFEVLLYNKVKFDGNSQIADFYEDASGMSIRIKPSIENDKLQRGFMALTLHFSKEPLALKRITRTDALNHSTTVTLLDPQFDVKFDDDYFVFKNPRTFGGNKR